MFTYTLVVCSGECKIVGKIEVYELYMIVTKDSGPSHPHHDPLIFCLFTPYLFG